MSSNVRTISCCELSHTHMYSLAFEADDGRIHCLATSQYVDMVIGCNPALATHPGAPPEQALMRFGDSEVIVLGSALKTVIDHIARGDLARLRSVPSGYKPPEAIRPFIVSIVVRRTTSQP